MSRSGQQKDIKIVVVAHKAAAMPQDPMYVPVFVGPNAKDLAKNTPDTKTDSTGKNIANKNPSFSELTALYWAWKNLKADYIGLAHYRRHFSLRHVGRIKNLDLVLSERECSKLLDKADVIVPRKRQYIIETLYSHYAHTSYVEPLDQTREIIAKKYPDFLPAFDRLKKRRSAHMFNMFVMKKDILDEYCDWLFDILFALEKETKTNYDSFHGRFYGRISELLLDVFLETKNIRYVETNFVYTEKVSYFAKIKGYLAAKFLGKKYGKSF